MTDTKIPTAAAKINGMRDSKITPQMAPKKEL
jgi:hypothetical protein